MRVCIVTVTQVSRRNFLNLLANGIKEQQHGARELEWLIITHGFTLASEDIIELQARSGILQILTIPVASHFTIAQCRERANRDCTADYIICMDDDDYQPPRRIQESLVLLKAIPYSELSKSIVVCTDHYFYDYDLNVYGCAKKNHQTCPNAQFAYHISYARTHHYNPSDRYAEETAFLDKAKLIHLDHHYGAVQLFHGSNTYHKRKFLLTLEGTGWDRKNKPIQFPSAYMEAMKQTFEENEQLPSYDIIYYCGFQIQGQSWLPMQENLSGSEQGVISLATAWVKNHGLKVAVYADLDLSKENEVINYQGVDYRHISTFRFRDMHYKNLILWRSYGLNSFPVHGHENICDRFIIEFQDSKQIKCGELDWLRSTDCIVPKSQFHRDISFPQMYHKHVHIISNGCLKERYISNNNNLYRDPYRFIYASCYTRGLVEILKYIWPHLIAYEPRFELHLYYGKDSIHDRQQLSDILRAIYQSTNICDHGRQSWDVIAYAKKTSMYHLYTTNTIVETDCISLRESYVAGCIPLMLNVNVFKERQGIHLPDSITEVNETTGKEIADWFIQHFNRLSLEPYIEQPSWEDIARQWVQEVLTPN